MYSVYVLRNENGAYYIGYTNNLKRRFSEHEHGRPGYRLVYYEAYANSRLARTREAKLKQYGSAWRTIRKRIEAA